MWNLLLEKGGPNGVAPEVLRTLGIYGGAQGIWVDKARTGELTDNGHGITVSLTHSGKSYPDDFSDDEVIYHYPDTDRPKSRDASEVEATKNTRRLGLPVFVITHTSHSRRDVSIGWVIDWDDNFKWFLVHFDNKPPLSSSRAVELLDEINTENVFTLFQQDNGPQRLVSGRKNQPRFKFLVLKRYGPACVVCGLSVPALLQAAHLVPKEHQGSDDPRNGLVLCANHHLAFDSNLFSIRPGTFELCYKLSGPDAQALGITFRDLHHLPHRPHDDALTWRYHHQV